MNYSEINYQIHEYKDINNTACKELLFTAYTDSCSNSCSNSCKILSYPYFVMIKDHNVKIRVPIYNISLKYFIPNYKEYFYIPSENICIPKALAGGMDKKQIKNATKETCYVSVMGEFIPSFSNPSFKLYKESASSAKNYIMLSDLKTKEALKQYISVLLNNILK